MDDKALFERLDRIIELLEDASQQPSIRMRVANGIATGVGIMGLISIVDVIKTWLGG